MNGSTCFKSALLFIASNVIAGITSAQLPFAEGFRNTTAPSVVFGGSPGAALTAGKTVSYPGGTVTDGSTDGYLRLTAANGNERGYAYYNNSFPANYGLKISFEYFTYGGNGADGICFFLFDAATPTFSIGGFGGSLGYAMRNTETGLSGAYLGIGMDEYGNFCNSTEGRNTPVGTTAIVPSTLTMRGKGDGTANILYNNITTGVANYNYITSVQTTALSPSFSISGGTIRHPLSTDADYRKVEIDLAPRTITVNGITGTAYTISLRILTGSAGGTVVRNVISNVNYDQLAPSNLKFGFAASTGGSNNYHEVRNINIASYNIAPNSPAAANRAQSVCSNNVSNFLLRDAVTPANTPLGLDSASLRFINPSNNLDTGTSFVIPNVGTISVDSNGKGRVTFVANAAFTSGSSAIRFVMKDNYGKISNPATLTLNAGAGITNNTIAKNTGSNVITGSTPVYSSAFTYLWQQSTTSATAGFSDAPNTNNTKDYNVATSTATRWFRRTVISGTCSSISTAQAYNALGTPLPVYLKEFTVTSGQVSNDLSWVMNLETGISEYRVESSKDGATFLPIGSVKAKDQQESRYDFRDADRAVLTYYRLNIQEVSGSSYFSKIISARSSGTFDGISAYPNPVSSRILIRLNADNDHTGLISIANVTGNVVYKVEPDFPFTSVDLASLPGGIYIIRYQNSVCRIVKL